MAIGAITMILTNVGLQMFNSWRGSKQNAELQQKREEFEQAARERNVEHMMKLMREGQELTLQIEKENHENRLNDIKGELDNLLQRLTYEMAITNWPLRVLPVVMKNQAFGNLLANQEEKLALHVILTRSNYDKFNNAVLPVIEKSLEQYCNQHWSTMSNHPVLFYSGAWKSRTAPTDVEVSAMKTSLSNLPTLLITPLFRPSDGLLVFQVNMWGVGAASTEEFAMTELEPTNFQRTFSNTDDYDKDGEVCYEIIEDIVPYLQCLIGYLADTYFWSSTGVAPMLPTLLTNGVINTDGLKYLTNEYRQSYELLVEPSKDLCRLESTPMSIKEVKKKIDYIEGILPIEDEKGKAHLQKFSLDYANKYLFFTTNQFPSDYQDLITFVNQEEKKNSTLTWVILEQFDESLNVCVEEERMNLCHYLKKFKDFVDSNTNKLDTDTVAVYIYHKDYHLFKIHVYDSAKKKILQIKNGFDFSIKTKRPIKLKNLKAIFKQAKEASIICRYNRIDILVEKLNDEDTLTF